MPPKQGRYLDLDSKQLGNNLTTVRCRLWQRHVVQQRPEILTFCQTYSVSNSVLVTLIAHRVAPNITAYRVGICSILDGELPVKRSRCGGQALEYLGFAIWTTLATSLLEAGSCGSVDMANGLIAREVPHREVDSAKYVLSVSPTRPFYVSCQLLSVHSAANSCLHSIWMSAHVTS